MRAILGNLSTHKPRRNMWLKRHPYVHCHYTPTHASWLSQIECWFSILAAQSLRGASFGSAKEPVAHIDSYNTTPRASPSCEPRSQSARSASGYVSWFSDSGY